MRHHIGSGHQQFGTRWPGANANQTNTARPSGQNICNALGIRFQVRNFFVFEVSVSEVFFPPMVTYGLFSKLALSVQAMMIIRQPFG